MNYEEEQNRVSEREIANREIERQPEKERGCDCDVVDQREKEWRVTVAGGGASEFRGGP
jgi:hypothetical protein